MLNINTCADVFMAVRWSANTKALSNSQGIASKNDVTADFPAKVIYSLANRSSPTPQACAATIRYGTEDRREEE
jgi:hypothetical protein